MAEEVEMLTEFRDDVLLSSRLGRAFVKLYYKASPPMADFIAEHDGLRRVVGWSLIPVVGVSWMALKIGPAPTLALIILILTVIGTTTRRVCRKWRLKGEASPARNSL